MCLTLSYLFSMCPQFTLSSLILLEGKAACSISNNVDIFSEAVIQTITVFCCVFQFIKIF